MATFRILLWWHMIREGNYWSRISFQYFGEECKLMLGSNKVYPLSIYTILLYYNSTYSHIYSNLHNYLDTYFACALFWQIHYIIVPYFLHLHWISKIHLSICKLHLYLTTKETKITHVYLI